MSIAVVGKVPGTVFLNRTASDPLVFRWGKGEIVRGLEIAVDSMKHSERAGHASSAGPSVSGRPRCVPHVSCRWQPCNGLRRGCTAGFLVRSDYGYGDDPPYAGLSAGSAVQFDVTLLGVGERDLTDGRGGVLLTVQEHGEGWEEPSPLDEVQVSLLGSAPDGTHFADSRGPVWVDLSAGLLPRGLVLALQAMKVGERARAVLSDAYIFSDRQLTARPAPPSPPC